MSSSLVAPAKKPSKEVFGDGNGVLSAPIERQEVREAAARLLAVGFRPRMIASELKTYLSPSGSEEAAYRKLKRWMLKDQSFRDLIYQQSILKLDLATPDILDGIR